MSVFFGKNHYTMNQDDLVQRQNLDDTISIPLGVSRDASGGAIDYREWLPTYIAPGYYLKWIDITQPEDQYHSGSEGKGDIVFRYIPKDLEISDDIIDKEFTDINMYVVSVTIAYDRSVAQLI